MIRILVAASALAGLAASGAQAQTIAAGHYAGTLQFTAVQDPFGLCTNLVAVGEVQASVGSFKLGAAPLITTPVPGNSSSGYGVGAQACTYPKLPATLDPGGTTTYNGTANCTTPNPTYPNARIVTGTAVDGVTGNTTVNSVAANTFKITTTSAALEVQVNGTFQPICFISTDALYLRTGK